MVKKHIQYANRHLFSKLLPKISVLLEVVQGYIGKQALSLDLLDKPDANVLLLTYTPKPQAPADSCCALR